MSDIDTFSVSSGPGMEYSFDLCCVTEASVELRHGIAQPLECDCSTSNLHTVSTSLPAQQMVAISRGSSPVRLLLTHRFKIAMLLCSCFHFLLKLVVLY